MEIGNTCKNFNTISPTFCLLGQKKSDKMGVKRPITIAVADQGFLKGGGAIGDCMSGPFCCAEGVTLCGRIGLGACPLKSLQF